MGVGREVVSGKFRNFTRRNQGKESSSEIFSKFPGSFPQKGVCYATSMNDFYESEIARLHEQLRGLYERSRGFKWNQALTPGEQMQVLGLWARIERLETTKAKIEVKESLGGTFKMKGGLG